MYRRLGIVILLIIGLAALAFIALHHAYRELVPADDTPASGTP